MTGLEENLLWVTIGLYLSNAVFSLISFWHKKRIVAQFTRLFFVTGVLLQLASLAYRAYLSGHLPGNDLYELNSLGGLLIVFIFLIIRWKVPELKVLTPLTGVIAVVLLLFGYLSNPQISPLPPLYRSEWFFFHISFAFLAFGGYIAGAIISFLYLMTIYFPHLRVRERLVGKNLDGIVFRLVSFSFIFHALMVITGAFWASTAWGNFWSWDPLETWSLISWLMYGTYLHLYLTFGWRGMKLAWFNLLALILVIFTFWGLGHLPGTIGGKK